MTVADIMTRGVVSCLAGTPLREAAQLMVEHDCGILPVVNDFDSMRLIGVITDRDITCKSVAAGMDPNTARVSQCMTAAPARVHPDDSLEQLEAIMADIQVRRVPVVNEAHSCVGIVSQADIALAAPGHVAAVVTEVSKPEKNAA